MFIPQLGQPPGLSSPIYLLYLLQDIELGRGAEVFPMTTGNGDLHDAALDIHQLGGVNGRGETQLSGFPQAAPFTASKIGGRFRGVLGAELDAVCSGCGAQS